MKKLVLLFALMLVLVLGVSVASATEYTNYTAGVQVVNLSSDTATIMFTFYDEGTGNQAGTLSDTIAGDSSSTYFPIGGVSAGFDGSAVISSDKPISAIVNVLGDTVNGGSYSSFSSGADTISLPLVGRNFFNIDTWFNVQNAGSSDVDVTVAYAGLGCDQTVTIKAGAAKTFDQASNTCLPDGHFGAATISAPGGSIVATAMQVGSNGLFAYNGFAQGSTDTIMPLVVANNFNFHTGVQVQNQGGVATDVTLSYVPAAGSPGTACTETKTIGAASSETFMLNAFSLTPVSASTTCTFGEAFVGSASVSVNSANQPLVAIVNQTDFGSTGSAYSSFNPDVATNTVVMPLILEAFGIFSGFNVVNVGTTGDVVCTFNGTDASFNVTADNVPNGGAMNDVQLGKGFPDNAGADNYVGGATCTGSGGALLLGVVNQSRLSGSGDYVLTYEATNTN